MSVYVYVFFHVPTCAKYLGVSCICLVYVLSRFSYVTLCDTMDWNPAGSSVHGLLQARILEWARIVNTNYFTKFYIDTII